MKRIFLLPLLPLALGAATVDKTQAMAKAIQAKDDQEALEWCKKPPERLSVDPGTVHADPRRQHQPSR